eukprot:CAMPEP_0194781654 /NCGR_PEP_ID=MMETSP0323_2-20130528/76905_1 /TAXON_ID=2866 ORGANISM="Crypthecodinium cohnii, Strain Seligo" /NCGR_SAMPLE_ID=MMETSP0323_2 /ASSEMBLY_ACC=CAM_ASM_000346 /LENGTH=97 /DNA_ID=CAMNT_0039720167 /DNA_START=55 /DNA_END=344 /DNA_ORIENTATION=-
MVSRADRLSSWLIWRNTSGFVGAVQLAGSFTAASAARFICPSWTLRERGRTRNFTSWACFNWRTTGAIGGLLPGPHLNPDPDPDHDPRLATDTKLVV